MARISLLLVGLLLSITPIFGATPFDDQAVTPAGSPALAQEAPAIIPAAPPPDDGKDAGKDEGNWFSRGLRFFARLPEKAKSGWEKVSGWFDRAKEEAKKVINLPGFYRQGHLSDTQTADLMNLAKARPELAWPANGDIATARNAHRTNTVDELAEALRGDHDWMECDMRLEGPLRDKISLPGGERRPITAHDAWQTNGILFEDWIGIIKTSGRGIKIDFKDNGAIDPAIAILQKAQIPEHRLIMNIGVPNPGEGPADGSDLAAKPVDDTRITHIRDAFPKAILNLSPGDATEDGHYSRRAVQQMIRFAKAAGQPVMFPLRAELVTPAIVAALKPFGKIAIWNSTSTYNPKDKEGEIRKFRSWGVDGMIDIMTQ